MSEQITTGALHHITLSTTDLQRAVAFYVSLLGFTIARERAERIILSNGSMALALRAPDPTHTPENDRFDEHRCGLDHLSFNVASRDDLEAAIRIFDERGISHGEIKDLADTDNIQLELAAPRG